MRPLEDRLYVRRGDGFITHTTSLLVVVQDKPQLETGTVEAVGAKVRDVEVGETVMYDRYAGEDYGDHYVFLKVDEVLAVVVSS